MARGSVVDEAAEEVIAELGNAELALRILAEGHDLVDGLVGYGRGKFRVAGDKLRHGAVDHAERP